MIVAMLCCCGKGSQTPGSPTDVIAPPPGDPVVIEPLPDVTVRQTPATVTPCNEPLSPHTQQQNWAVFDNDVPQGNKKPLPPPLELSHETENDNFDKRSALDDHLNKRAYILGISDDELAQLPIAYVESFYPNLSPGEIMQLEQRLCELKTAYGSKINPHRKLNSSSEKFLRSIQAQFSIRSNNSGFWVEDEVGGQTGLDVRDLILIASDDEISTLDAQTISRIQPFLSVSEFEDIRERIELVKISRRAQQELPRLPSEVHEPISENDSVTFVPPPVDSNIYHLTATPSYVTDDETSEGMNSKMMPAPPIIQVNGVEESSRDRNNSRSIEDTVQTMVDDILRGF